jgi:hypothetical protein
MNHSAQVILAISIAATFCLTAWGWARHRSRSFITSRARIGSTESTGQLTVSFCGLAFPLSGQTGQGPDLLRVRWMSLKRIEANRKTLYRTAAANRITEFHYQPMS